MKLKIHSSLLNKAKIFLFSLVVLCILSNGTFAQIAKEFWFAAPDITDGHCSGTCPGGEPLYISVAALELEADVTIEIPAAGITIDNITLNPGESQRIDLTSYKNDLEHVDPGIVDKKGLHVSSTNPITAYYEVAEPFNQDIFSLKGDNAMGTEFYTPFQNQWSNGNYSPQPYSGFIIVASENNTQVNIDPSAGIQANPTGTPDAAFSITLDKGETFACIADGTAPGDHLMGSYISSNKPISVTKYDDSSNHSAGGCKDLIGDQLVPTDVIGHEYIVTKGQLNSDERIFILGTENNTDVYIAGNLEATIDAGETYSNVLIDDATHVDATEPIYLLHVGGYGCEVGGAILPTVDDCTGSTEVSFTRSSTEDFFMNLMFRSGPAEATFYLEYESGNTFNIPAHWFDTVPNTGGDYMYLDPAYSEFEDNTSDGVPTGEVTKIYNTEDVFHMGFNNGGSSSGCNYGYFSDFKESDASASEAGTEDTYIKKCFGDPVQLTAYGGLDYHWSPETYLDDPYSPYPVLEAIPGTYTYEVTVNRPCYGDTIVDVDVKIFERVEADFSLNQAYGCSPLEVEITDESVGADTTQYRWEYGDGSSINYDYDSVHTHTYINNTDTTQQYRLHLLVKNEDDCVDTLGRTITVEPWLNAELEPAPDTSGCNPLPVQFRNNTTGGNMDSTTYHWEFGDNNSSNDSIPSHTFENPSGDDTTYTTVMTAESKFGCLAHDTTEITVHSFIKASFTLDTTKGCSPVKIDPDGRDYPGISEYTWYLEGIDTISNTGSDPGEPGPFTYINHSDSPDTLEMKLLVENTGGCRDSLVREVIVFPEVQANLTPMDTASCNPMEVNYTNLSSYIDVDDATSFSYEWDFGDGNTSEQINPSHTFVNPDYSDTTYNVSLRVTSPNGCTHDTTGTAGVYSYIKAAFSAANVKGCSPLTVSVENTSKGNINHYWFRDDDSLDTTNADSTISDTDFTITYNNTTGATQEKYLTLIVSNSRGCTDTVKRKITIHPEVTADFSPGSTTDCNPYEFTYDNQSHYTTTTENNNLNYSWDFGDGGTSSQIDPTHEFTNSLVTDTTYNVELAVESDDGCVDTAYGDVTVHDYIKADFSVSEPVGCAPYTISIDEYSKGGINEYRWDFGDGNDTIDATGNFTHEYENLSDTIATYPLTLIVSNNDGCEDTLTRNIKVYPDVEPDFDMSVSADCHPVAVDFTNTSTPDGDLSYTWDFGDGGTSNQEEPSHTFHNFSKTNDSIYTVRLVAESDYYCRDTTEKTVQVYHNPKAKMDVNQTESCPPFDLEATNESIGESSAEWHFGDDSPVESELGTVNHTYDNTSSNVANHDLKLIATTNQGCQDSTQLRLSVYPRVTADFDYDPAGCHPFNTQFNNQSDNANYYHWDFDDGVTSNLENPLNRFENTNQSNKEFEVFLRATSEYNCKDSIEQTVTVYPSPNAEFAVTPVLQIYPNATVSIDNNTNHTDAGIWDYSWNFGDGETSTETQPGEYKYNDWGDYDITLEAESEHCYDEVTHSISIIAPTPRANFKTDTKEGCMPLTVEFTDQSLYAEEYDWDFDDGGTSENPNPTYTFEEAGTYYVKQTIEGEGGEDYAYKTIRVHQIPEVKFEIEPRTVMLPDEEIKCYNFSKYGEYYTWHFGDGNRSEEKNPTHLYEELGEFDIKLVAESEEGCIDSLRKEDYVEVQGKGRIEFPNAFTPSTTGPSDGYWEEGSELDLQNEIFHPVGEGIVEYKLTIFNKWGEKLFESNDYNIGWDGYYQGRLQPQDVYIWKVKAKFANGETVEKMGDVTLIK